MIDNIVIITLKFVSGKWSDAIVKAYDPTGNISTFDIDGNHTIVYTNIKYVIRCPH